MELLSVYVPTNHIYIGDIFLLQRADVIRTSLSVREGLGAALLHAAKTACKLALWGGQASASAGCDKYSCGNCVLMHGHC